LFLPDQITVISSWRRGSAKKREAIWVEVWPPTPRLMVGMPLREVKVEVQGVPPAPAVRESPQATKVWAWAQELSTERTRARAIDFENRSICP
jgi:hypothetical protein